MRRPIRVVIADDHPVVRQGLCKIVESDGDCAVVAQASTVDEMWCAPLDACDVLVLDLAIPGAVGLSAVAAVHERVPTLPILILSVASEEQFAVRALRAGASGFLTKRTAPDQLVSAIQHVANGGVHVSVAVSRQLAMEVLRPGRETNHGPSSLSNREIEVLRLYASGLTATAIATQLEVSIKTISTHRRRLLDKLGLESNAALVRYAVRQHLVDP